VARPGSCNSPANDFNSIVRWLRTSAAYPQLPERVDIVETHISVIFLAGEFVYKLKRPVRYDFLDFTTIEKRELACREEIRLNCRLAPDIYLAAIPITCETDGSLRLGGAGAVVDWLVKMRRLPVNQTLESLVRRHELRPEQIDQLASVLAQFYRSLTPLSMTPDKYRDRYTAHVRGNLDELLAVSHHCPINLVRRVHSFQLQLLNLRPDLFAERVRSGRLVEGHGDLRPEHICFCEPLAIFDCIEFNSEFRQVDVADEMAFLAAECDFLDARWIGEQLFRTMALLRGDRPPPVLIDFYKSYRACVRAKVNALRADQLTGSKRDAAASEANAHLARADSYIQTWQRRLVLVVGGLSGTGKSTLAATIAAKLGCELLQTDVIRLELFGKSERTTEFEQGHYRREARQQVYAAMFSRAKALHADGISVVLDGTFSIAQSLREAQRTICDPHTVFLAIECVCGPAVARQRIFERMSRAKSLSEMRPELIQQQSINWEPWPAELTQFRISSEQTLKQQFANVCANLAHQFPW
jgi:uncharacterized protein